MSDARLGFCLPTGDRPARRGVVLLDRGVVLLEPRLDRGVPVEGRRFLMGETESWGALWVLVALAMTLAASWVSVIGGRRCWGEAEGWRRECCFNSILKKTNGCFVLSLLAQETNEGGGNQI